MDGGAHHRTSPAHRHPWHKPTGDPVGSPEGRSSSRVLGAPRKGVGGWGLKAFHGILSPRIPPPSLDQTPRAPGRAGDAQWLMACAISQPDSSSLPLAARVPPLRAPGAFSGGPVMPGTGRGDGRWTRGSYAAPRAPIRMATGPRRPPEGGWGPCAVGPGVLPKREPGWLGAKAGGLRARGGMGSAEQQGYGVRTSPAAPLAPCIPPPLPPEAGRTRPPPEPLSLV